MKKILTAVVLSVLLAPYCLNAQTPLKFRDTAIKGPQTFAIIMGVSKYKYVRPLTYADKDAVLFRDFMKSPGGGNLKDENIFSLLNEEALASAFWTKGFQWLRAKQLQKGDRLFIYLAGHGDAIDEDQYFFLSYDCNPAGDKNNYLVGGAIQLFNLKKKIANETAKGVEVFLVMDACRSNELPGGQEGLNFLNTAISEKKVGEVMMLATAAGQESLEDASIGNGHGLFTYYLVDGLSGVADTEGGKADNKVTFAEIRTYVDKNVPSIALQRFKKKQDPYFCCNENSSKIISNVDPAYLQKWLKEKNRRGGGNSFNGFTEADNKRFAADTALIETYNRFNRAIKSSNLTGNSSAEDYYRQLEKKFPNNPYTLDAKTTLAAEFVNDAQKKVNNYLGCGIVSSAKEKQENAAAGSRLEKAITLLQPDEPEFANALRGRMYFLKATGDYGSAMDAFTYAHAARTIDPNGAYILNWLSRLHLENKRNDSAAYYADKAAKAAPKWPCALTTLALVQQATSNNPNSNKDAGKKPKPGNGIRKFQFGGVAGGGISQLTATTITPSANDTIIGVNVNGRFKYDLGLIGQVNLSSLISIRPSVLISVEETELVYEKRRSTGVQGTETVPVKRTTVAIPVPVVIRFSKKNVTPFISVGPTFSLLMQKTDVNSDKLAIKPIDLLGDAGLGVDIGLLKSHIIISPEIKYSKGLLDVKEDKNVSFSRLISKLNRQNFTFSIYIRAR